MIGWLSCSLLSALFRVSVLVAGLVTVYLTSTIRLPQRRIPRRGSHISFLGIVAHTSHILQNHECRLPHEFVIDLNNYTSPQSMETIGKTRNGHITH
jgi:hypothetical protein